MYCFTKAHEILTIKLMATNSECRAQCILAKNWVFNEFENDIES